MDEVLDRERGGDIGVAIYYLIDCFTTQID